MRTIRFTLTLLVTTGILLFAKCSGSDTTDRDPAGESIHDSIDDYENTDWNDDQRPERHPRVSDTVDVKPMP